MAAIPWERLERMQIDITPELQSVLNKSGAAAAKALVQKGIPISFDQVNPAAVEWVTAHAAELVTQNIIPSTQEAIRAILVRSFEEGETTADAARLIREHIGILPRHAAAVEKYRQSMIAFFTEKGIPSALADANNLAMGYARKLLNYRAKSIARTETIRAANEGQQFLWNQAIGKDVIRENEWEREWIADESERTCPTCSALHGTRAPMRGPFEGGFMMPPAHPMCRCSIGLAEKEQLVN